MLHAPTAETKAETTQSKSAPVSLPTRKSKAPSSLLRQPSLDQVTVHLLLKLQRTIGNQAVLTTLRSQKTNTTAQPLSEPGFDHNFSRISGLSPQQTVLPQTKLKVSQPGDAYEQEAEQVAEQIMRIADEESSPSDGVEEAENFLPHKQASEPGTNLATPSPTVLARQPLQEASSPSTETNPPYKPEENMAQGNVETVIAEANHLKYRVYGFDIGSSDVLKPGIKEMLDYIVEELKAVNVLQVAITGLASESQLKGEGAYIYGLERAEAVKRYLAGSKATYSITAISVGSTSAPSASASPREKAYARAVIIDIRYTGSLPGINIELKPGPLDWNKIEQGKERMLTQEAREHRELPVFKQSNLAGYTYRYDHIIGLERHSSDLVDDLHTVLWALEGNPSNYFPFNVEGQSGEKSIVLGSEYDLVNKPGKLFPLPPGRHPIKVTEVTEHSFTFTTLEGHFDTPGSTITFTIYKDINGIIHLEQYGVALPSKEPSFKFLLAPDMAKFAWDEQADNLRKWLESAGQHPLLLPGK